MIRSSRAPMPSLVGFPPAVNAPTSGFGVPIARLATTAATPEMRVAVSASPTSSLVDRAHTRSLAGSRVAPLVRLAGITNCAFPTWARASLAWGSVMATVAMICLAPGSQAGAPRSRPRAPARWGWSARLATSAPDLPAPLHAPRRSGPGILALKANQNATALAIAATTENAPTQEWPRINLAGRIPRASTSNVEPTSTAPRSSAAVAPWSCVARARRRSPRARIAATRPSVLANRPTAIPQLTAASRATAALELAVPPEWWVQAAAPAGWVARAGA
jgi:hypothetical protein